MNTQQVGVAQTTQKQDTMFNLTAERNVELSKLASPIFQQYADNKITNCELVTQAIAVTDNEEEKYYLAYQAGLYQGKLSTSSHSFENYLNSFLN